MANSNWRSLKPVDLSPGNAKLLTTLQAANATAAEAKKALKEALEKTLFPTGIPAGKEVVVMAKWGGVSVGIVDAEPKKASKQTLAQWLEAQAA